MYSSLEVRLGGPRIVQPEGCRGVSWGPRGVAGPEGFMGTLGLEWKGHMMGRVFLPGAKDDVKARGAECSPRGGDPISI